LEVKVGSRAEAEPGAAADGGCLTGFWEFQLAVAPAAAKLCRSPEMQMKTVLRNTLAVIVGLVVGGTVNMALIVVGPHVIPPPAGVDVTDPQSLSNSMHLFEPKHFVFPFLAHALGTLTGVLLAFLVAASYRSVIAYAIGGFFLVGGIAAAFMIPAPVWFIILDLAAAYIPMAWLATQLGRRIIGGAGASKT
jgi:hypothetical protein